MQYNLYCENDVVKINKYLAKTKQQKTKIRLSESLAGKSRTKMKRLGLVRADTTT